MLRKIDNKPMALMTQIGVTKIRDIQLNILKEVDTFCKINNIKYSLTYGTLIGAVRHKGYIPWDDDIDIMMPRPDYEKFITQFNLNQTKFRVLSTSNSKTHPYPYAKVEDTSTVLIEYSNIKYKIGVNIDVFPIDGMPSNKKQFLKHAQKLKRYENLLGIKTIKLSNNRSFFKNMVLLFLIIATIFISYKKIIVLTERANRKYNYTECEYAMAPCYNVSIACQTPKTIFKEFISVKFENSYYSAIKEYDTYLRVIYGNYLKLPPPEEQVSHHNYEAFLK